MMEQSVLSETKRWFKDLLKAGEAAIEAAEHCPWTTIRKARCRCW